MPTMTTRDPAPGPAPGDGGAAVGPTHDDRVAGDGGLVGRLEDLQAASGLYVALAAAWTSMLGSLYFSEVRGFTPCTLCWYQRILMYPLAAILLVAIGRRDRGAHLYVLPLSVLGIGFSTYHYLIQ
ncbi:MAG: disulfide bond formation protein B, partial [Anaerolineae bacterium]